MARIRGVARKSTGGKAPRKSLSHPALMRFNRQHPQLRQDYVADKENQTHQSTSDVQIQIGADTKTIGTQTDQQNPAIEVKREFNAPNDIVEYLQDELATMRRRLHQAESMQKELETKPTTTCSNVCCKKNE